MNLLPGFDDILAAAARIAPYASVTPVLRSAALDTLAGAELHFKCENLQRGGAFKFRGACNAVWSLDDGQAAHGVVTHSSGNHGNALALAAATRGIAAHVVVPEGAVRAKLAAIERAGAILHRCAPTQAAREATCAEVQRATGAELVHPYADTRVMAGQGTLALELLQQAPGLDALITPVGGGGLASGVAIAAHGIDPALDLFGAEPLGADDAAQSLARGTRVTTVVPDTVCDGLRALVGERNLDALRTHRVEVITVSDAETVAAMRLLWSELKQVVEVSSATVFAAILKQPQRFAGRRVGVVLTGGNVDLDALPW
ncbi:MULTISPECIES: pyridoxal-phosphate dependent enzyme [Rhodanobacter]|uniref:pyridoxal-phosphate dependent enzyme n=1 Tax=Rhodanobacter TaxID=75309 RepID=UPI000411884B|nr:MULTISPECIES: pyridoxal-phosphate dependent enzyme [Rhodanobacter]KZC18548.1 serine dehydratase [Rhodanobacter denitrificans]UJJ50819.1 pyridoxal-phosphate dependent enzyme [Rhodanobacter denitrificans]UJJ56981.1 pyridoxal-phosphate dependent enzyme [Rhodanobacter denitrificans]UJM93534.1 pyridoxal-phosphate dependent enzyme [Rhodanobacter denitrificans]UJM97065.1 pyridoxal-phosphate dependent enzyme [Rhodanobacter denitrificans]